MHIICVIPSRIGSTRLPQKPLALIKGKPMVAWVYENAKRCQAFSEVIVATDHPSVVEIIENLGGKAVMTDPDLPTGSDRVAVAAKLYPQYENVDVIVNVQGDQPFVNAKMLNALVAPYLADESPAMATLACPLDHTKHANDPNIPKVITDQTQHAIYFSRAPIPYLRNKPASLNDLPVYHHLGVYAYQRYFLEFYQNMPQTPLEKVESLEQLRAVENGYRIRVSLVDNNATTLEVNTPEELQQAELADI